MLTEIRENVTLVCEAIASAIAMDVTIVDANLIRIAGTGRYRYQLGECISHHSAFEYALKSRDGIVIPHPGKHQICKVCEGRGSCIEYAEVCWPIYMGEEPLGVIGLIAFDEVQRERLLSQSEQLLEFLKRMADLIASKAGESKQAKHNERLMRELESIINHVDIGLCLLNADGSVRRQNKTAEKLLKWDDQSEETQIRFKQLLKTAQRNKKFQISRDYAVITDIIPIDNQNLREGYLIKVQDVVSVIKTANALTQEPVTTTFDDICGASKIMAEVKNYALRIANTPSSIMILGESGTGKELFARAIHNASDRREAPFVAINCAAIPEQLLESELFGYEEGAFTGARKGGKLGKFHLADRGTIFLDEIGDMSLYLQAKLLRVIQEGQIEPIGGHFPHRIDVRIIAATHRPLQKSVREGAFREDLFYRLNVMPLVIPPLRERPEDIRALCMFLLPRISKKLANDVKEISDACLKLFLGYEWPGNVRELENTLEYAVNMCDGQRMEPEHLPKQLQMIGERLYQSQGVTDQVNSVQNNLMPLPFTTLSQMEMYMIEQALEMFGGDKDKASKYLGISRATLYRKIKSETDK